MGKVWVKELTGGLDTRRLPATTPGGLLIKGQDGHINSGGEFEKRAAFVSTYSLPAGTVGLAADTAGIVVFGSAAEPSGMPSGVAYQRLQKSAKTLAAVPSYDLYGGDIYAAAEFDDGTIVHFFDAVEVTDWFDGRARASFTVTGGTGAIASSASFEITGGTLGGSRIDTVTVDGVEILGAAVSHTGSNASTATDVAAQITSNTSAPDYTATADGAAVTVTAAVTGTAANGDEITIGVSGDATASPLTAFSGGAISSRVTDITVAGVSIISALVEWAGSTTETAEDIATAINAFTATSGYEATSSGTQVNIIVEDPGAAGNGRAVEFIVSNGFEVTPSTGLKTADGADSDAFTPGTFVRTIGSKMYALSGSVMHFSGIREPTQWTTDATGAGFFDMAQETSGAEELLAIANYQGFAAIFAENVVPIFFIDPDPDLVRRSQILKNTGAVSPQSVTEFGDADLFYLALSGLRSLRARDSSNSASTTDLGVPVDTLITAKLGAMSTAARQTVRGLINPVDDRFWLIFPDGTIFVFSFYPNGKVSAWTTYEAGFDVDAVVVFGRRVHLRSGNTIYVYGGLDSGSGLTYDSTTAKCWLPFFDADNPTEKKQWQGMDAAVEGTWDVYAAAQPTDETIREQIATITETTYNRERIPFAGNCTHVSPQLESSGSGEAKVSSFVLHYEGGEDG